MVGCSAKKKDYQLYLLLILVLGAMMRTRAGRIAMLILVLDVMRRTRAGPTTELTHSGKM